MNTMADREGEAPAEPRVWRAADAQPLQPSHSGAGPPGRVVARALSSA